MSDTKRISLPWSHSVLSTASGCTARLGCECGQGDGDGRAVAGRGGDGECAAEALRALAHDDQPKVLLAMARDVIGIKARAVIAHGQAHTYIGIGGERDPHRRRT